MIILLRSRVRRRIDEVAAALVCVAAVFVAVAVFRRRRRGGGGKVFAAEGFAAGALLVRAAAAEARGRVGGGVPLGEGDGEGAVGMGGVSYFCLGLGGYVYGVKGEAYEVAKRARVKNCMIADEELG